MGRFQIICNNFLTLKRTHFYIVPGDRRGSRDFAFLRKGDFLPENFECYASAGGAITHRQCGGLR